MGVALKQQGGAARTKLIEREAELERIEALLAEVSAARGATLLIEGAPGIGKTALLEVARELAVERGIAVLWARAAALERELAFGVVRQLLEPYLRRFDATDRAELFAGAARLAEGPLGLADDSEAEGRAAPGSELHGLYWLCANLADRVPLLVAIDDLHWSDEPSLRFLSYLARRASEHPLLICAASRPTPTEAEGALAATLATGFQEVLRPRPLSEAGVECIVRERLSADAEPAFCAACARASGGNPFLLAAALEALLADRVDPLDSETGRVERLRAQTLSGALLARLARLGPVATSVARAVATLGTDALLRRVARLADLGPEAAAALEGLRREGILAPGRKLEFVHPLIENAVEADLAEPERGLAHLAAARLLAEEGEPAERIAAHLLVAEPSADPWVVENLRAAAAAALGRGAPGPAASLLERALAEPPEEGERGPLLVELGRALTASGRLDFAITALRRALELARGPHARAEIALDAGLALFFDQRWAEALEVLEQARRDLSDSDRELALRLALEIALVSHAAGASARALVANLEAAGGPALLTEPEGPVESMVAAACAFGAAGSGDRPADEVVRIALAASKERPAPADSYSVNFKGVSLAIAGRPDLAIEVVDDAIDAAKGMGDATAFRFASAVRSLVGLVAGSPREAEADARAALEAAEEGALVNDFALGLLVRALLARGRVNEAKAALAEHGRDETQDLASFPRWTLLQGRGQLRIALGRHRDAVDDLLGCGELLGKTDFVNPAFSAWRSLAALAHLGLGEVEPARRLAAEELELARAFEAPRPIGIALRVSGLIEGGERGIELLRESASVLDRSEAELELARSLVEYGAALRRAGRRPDAREPLRRGLDLASRCGTPPLAERAREELVAAGGRPRRAVLSGPDSLTASERRVARLAVEGMSNREIAQALFVTRRTVEMHLTSAYGKLEIGSRDELAAALGGAEPGPDRRRSPSMDSFVADSTRGPLTSAQRSTPRAS